MKTRAFGLLVIPTILFTLPGCDDQPTCPYGEVLVHDGYASDGVCVRQSYSNPSASGTTTPPAATTSPPPAAPASGDGASGGAATTPAPAATAPAAATCGGVAATSDNVRVVDKREASPTFADAAPNLADGSYALVQATYYTSSQGATPVRSLKATLDVKGPTLTVNSTDTSVSGLPNESFTFLLATSAGMTKTCESVHGSVSAWFFPFAVGGSATPQLAYDNQSGFLRVVVARADGATELVFAR